MFLSYVAHNSFIQFTDLIHFVLQAKNVHLDVQRISIRCLGLFGLLDKRANEKVLKQLRDSFIKGLHPISIMACKALFDLVMWHGPHEIDKALGQDYSLQSSFDKISFSSINLSEANEVLTVGSLDLLYAGLDKDERYNSSATNEIESVQTIVAEGFAKILLLSENYSSMPASLHPPLLSKLVNIYFSSEKDLERWFLLHLYFPNLIYRLNLKTFKTSIDVFLNQVETMSFCIL